MFVGKRHTHNATGLPQCAPSDERKVTSDCMSASELKDGMDQVQDPGVHTGLQLERYLHTPLVTNLEASQRACMMHTQELLCDGLVKAPHTGPTSLHPLGPSCAADVAGGLALVRNLTVTHGPLLCVKFGADLTPAHVGPQNGTSPGAGLVASACGMLQQQAGAAVARLLAVAGGAVG